MNEYEQGESRFDFTKSFKKKNQEFSAKNSKQLLWSYVRLTLVLLSFITAYFISPEHFPEICIVAGIVFMMSSFRKTKHECIDDKNSARPYAAYAVVLSPTDNDGNKLSDEQLKARAQEIFAKAKEDDLREKFDFKK